MAQVPAKFLKQSQDVLAYPLSRIISFSVRLSLIPEECNIVKTSHYLRKAQKVIPKTIDLFQFCL